MIVTVVKAGIYAGPGFISLPFAEEGATIDIQDGWYAQTMIEGGHVALPAEPAAPVVAEAVSAEPEPTKKKGK